MVQHGAQAPGPFLDGLMRDLSAPREILLAFDESQALIRGRDGRIRFWSRGSERLYGWQRHEAAGAVSHELLKTDFPTPLAEIEAVLVREGVWHGNLTHRHRDGHLVHVASHWVLRGTEANGAVIEINNDISERIESEHSLLRYGAIVENSDDAIIGKTMDGVITTWNKGAETIFGWRAEEIVGHPVTVLIPPDRIDEESALLERLRHGESIHHLETVRRPRTAATSSSR